MKYFFWLAVLLVLVGCQKERIADIATADEILEKDVLMIFPSIPEQFCYADHITEMLNDLQSDMNGTDAQVLSVDGAVDCSSYGYTQCVATEYTSKSQKSVATIKCSSNDGSKECLYFMGEEYRDADGQTFEQSCIMGIKR